MVEYGSWQGQSEIQYQEHSSASHQAQASNLNKSSVPQPNLGPIIIELSQAQPCFFFFHKRLCGPGNLLLILQYYCSIIVTIDNVQLHYDKTLFIKVVVHYWLSLELTPHLTQGLEKLEKDPPIPASTEIPGATPCPPSEKQETLCIVLCCTPILELKNLKGAVVHFHKLLSVQKMGNMQVNTKQRFSFFPKIY